MAAPLIDVCFNKIDMDKNGFISMDELVDVFKAFDTDGDNLISKDEFRSAFSSKFGGTPEQADRAFKKLDKDSDSKLDLGELREFFHDMDKDDNGSISKAEFVEFWKLLLA